MPEIRFLTMYIVNIMNVMIIPAYMPIDRRLKISPLKKINKMWVIKAGARELENFFPDHILHTDPSITE